MAIAMRLELILALVLLFVVPSYASHESGRVGPYNISFDVNTTMDYRVIVESPSKGVTDDGVNYTRYNLTVQSAEYIAWIVLTDYERPMLASINANRDVVVAALMGAGADEPKLYQPLIDGQPGVLGSFRYESLYLGQGASRQGDIVVAASYSPDGRVYDDGQYRGRVNLRVISTYPWEVIRDLLYTLHVQVPDEAPSEDPLERLQP